MSQVTSSIASRLGESLATPGVISDPVSVGLYEIDGRRPSAALTPATVAECAEILKFATAERLGVIPVGGRTHLHIGMPPTRYDLALDVSKLKGVFAYEPQDLTVSVHAGTPYSELDQLLRQKRQFLPLAPSLADRATVAGIVAAGADSPLRYAHGTARDFLLGLEFVTAEGLICKSGSHVVKNVSGYDLHKLLIGSLGTLAIITRLNFRTFPMPPGLRMFVASFPDSAGALGYCRSVMKSQLQPRILDVFDPAAARMLGTGTAVFAHSEYWHVIIEAAGQEPVLSRHQRDLALLSQETKPADFAVLDEAQRDQFFNFLCDFPRAAFDETPATTAFRISTLPASLPKLIAELRNQAEIHALRCAILVRGMSAVFFALSPSADAKVHPELISCSREIMNWCANSGVPAVIERCPLDLKRSVGVWPAPGSEEQIAQRLKSAFDPQCILSPGRFRGGI